MDIAAALKSVESIAGAVKEMAPHLKGVNIGSLVGLSRAGGTLAPILLVGGASLAVGAGVALLLAPQTGPELRAALRTRATDVTVKLRRLAEQRRTQGAEEAEASQVLASAS